MCSKLADGTLFDTAFDTAQWVAESNRIENISRHPTPEELAEHKRFVNTAALTVDELQRFVFVYQRNAVLRDRPGLNVRVGSHIPPKGGPHIRTALEALLHAAEQRELDPWGAHVQYEMLHPFTDCNGRSGRVVWAWMTLRSWRPERVQYGFLRAFYYETLQSVQARKEKKDQYHEEVAKALGISAGSNKQLPE